MGLKCEAGAYCPRVTAFGKRLYRVWGVQRISSNCRLVRRNGPHIVAVELLLLFWSHSCGGVFSFLRGLAFSMPMDSYSLVYLGQPVRWGGRVDMPC
jgi:hypothetical protein